MAELDIGAIFGDYIGEIAHLLGEAGVAPAGPPYCRYHEFGPDTADIEIGMPVSAPPVGLPGDTEPESPALSELPGGSVAVAVHRGPYGELGETYRALEAWAEAESHRLGPGPWESYLDDPWEVAAAELRTEVCWPLA